MTRPANWLLAVPLAVLFSGCASFGATARLPGAVPDGDNPVVSLTADLCGGGNLDQEAPSTARRQAEKAVELLAKMKTHSPEMVSRLVIDATETGRMRLGEPLAVKELTVTSVQSYQDGDSSAVARLLRRNDQYVFPITLQSENGTFPNSAVTVMKGNANDEWKIVSIGRQHLVNSLFRQRLARAAEQVDEKHFLLDVPALYQLFLATCRGDELTLGPVFGEVLFGAAMNEHTRGEAQSGLASFASMFQETGIASLDESVKAALDKFLDEQKWPLKENGREMTRDQFVRLLKRKMTGVWKLQDVLEELDADLTFSPPPSKPSSQE